MNRHNKFLVHADYGTHRPIGLWCKDKSLYDGTKLNRKNQSCLPFSTFILNLHTIARLLYQGLEILDYIKVLNPWLYQVFKPFSNIIKWRACWLGLEHSLTSRYFSLAYTLTGCIVYALLGCVVLLAFMEDIFLPNKPCRKCVCKIINFN